MSMDSAFDLIRAVEFKIKEMRMSSYKIPLLKLQVNYMYISVPASAKRKKLMPKKLKKLFSLRMHPAKKLKVIPSTT